MLSFIIVSFCFLNVSFYFTKKMPWFFKKSLYHAKQMFNQKSARSILNHFYRKYYCVIIISLYFCSIALFLVTYLPVNTFYFGYFIFFFRFFLRVDWTSYLLFCDIECSSPTSTAYLRVDCFILISIGKLGYSYIITIILLLVLGATLRKHCTGLIPVCTAS